MTRIHINILKLVYTHNELLHVAAMWARRVQCVFKLLLMYIYTFVRTIIIYSNNAGILDHRKLRDISFIPEGWIKREQK